MRMGIFFQLPFVDTEMMCHWNDAIQQIFVSMSLIRSSVVYWDIFRFSSLKLDVSFIVFPWLRFGWRTFPVISVVSFFRTRFERVAEKIVFFFFRRSALENFAGASFVSKRSAARNGVAGQWSGAARRSSHLEPKNKKNRKKLSIYASLSSTIAEDRGKPASTWKTGIEFLKKKNLHLPPELSSVMSQNAAWNRKKKLIPMPLQI